MSLTFLVDMLRAPGVRPRNFVVHNPLPSDTRLVGLHVAEDINTLWLHLESDVWPEVASPHLELMPRVRVLWPDEP